jgi:hypothetical protein
MPITNPGPPPVKKTATAKPVALSPVSVKRQDAIASLGALAQVPLIAVKLYADAGAVSLYWPKIAREISLLADTNEQIAKLVDPLMQVGPYAGLITAVLPFALQIGVNHKRLPAGAMGTVPASTLAAQIETALAKAELEALRTQYEAERQSRAMRDDILNARRAMDEALADAA